MRTHDVVNHDKDFWLERKDWNLFGQYFFVLKTILIYIIYTWN